MEVIEKKIVLVIYGNGNMRNFTESDVPWKEYGNNIHQINIQKGITNIGNYAFDSISEIKTIYQ